MRKDVSELALAKRWRYGHRFAPLDGDAQDPVGACGYESEQQRAVPRQSRRPEGLL